MRLGNRQNGAVGSGKWQLDIVGGALAFSLRLGYPPAMTELIFEIIQEADGGFVAECLTENIVTEADTWEQLRENVREVVHAYFFDAPEKTPKSIRLHLQRDEVFACA